MRFLYITDMHGDKNKYEKILEVAIKEKIKYIIDGGDILPKQIKRLEGQPIYIREFLRNYFDRLRKYNITYLGMLGNDDIFPMDNLFNELCEKYNNVHNIASNKIELEGYEFIGMNFILDHPFGCKDRVIMEDNFVFQQQISKPFYYSKHGNRIDVSNWFEYARNRLPKMKDILNTLPKPINKQKTIYIMHIPPADLKLGQLLYRDLDVGSKDVYNFIKLNQPLLTLHGHIHESPDTKNGKWNNVIDNTTCIQPGQTEANSNVLIYVDADLTNQKYTREKVSINSI